jgi:PPK2 family polyphosphate:nucleotide phosphotransferase
MNIDDYRFRPGAKFQLADHRTKDEGGLSKPEATKRTSELRKRLFQLQELLYAERRHALLVVLQAMDTGGKDSLIRSVFSGINPQGCTVHNFKTPSEEELAHDFLWRVHARTPPLGYVGVFNRSHYEDVLIVRVKALVEESVWRARYEHINAFERTLHDGGTTVIKFFLHISKDYQKKRLERRLGRPEKRWKFNPGDLAERERWEEYQAAYEDALRLCSTKQAPWYVIPAERRWYRDLVVAEVLVAALEGLDMRLPAPDFDPTAIVIK